MPSETNALVSVVIPTYNRAGVICRALDSVLAQTYENYEVIIVDDGSTDNTVGILKPYLLKDNFRYIFQTNRRQAAARNRGIQESKGALVAFLDSDDEWVPQKLRKQVDLLERDVSVGMVYSNQLVRKTETDPGAVKYPRGLLPSGRIFDSLLCGDFYCSTPGIVVRREALDEAGWFDESLADALEDWDLTLRIAWRRKVAVIDEPLFIRYANTRTDREYALRRIRNHRRIVSKIFDQCNVGASLRLRVARKSRFSHGHKLLCAGCYGRSIVNLIAAAVLCHPKAVILIALALLGPAGRLLLRRYAEQKPKDGRHNNGSPSY